MSFFGDTIDTIRLFDVETQKSFEKKDSIKIYKAIEWDLQEDFSEGLKHIKDDYKKTKSKLKEESRKNLEETFKEVIEGIRLDVERLYPYYYQQFLSVIDIFSECLIFVDEYSQVYNSLKAFEQETQEIFSDLLEKGFVLPKMAECYFTTSEVLEKLSRSIILQTFVSAIKELELKDIISFNFLRELPSYNGQKEVLIDDLKYYMSKRYTINIFTGSRTSLEDLADALLKEDIQFSEAEEPEVERTGVYLIARSIEKGIEVQDLKLVYLSFFHLEKKKENETKKRIKSKKDAFYTIEDLKPGDFVVHRTHGIGKFLGFEKITVEGTTKEYVKLEYANSSYLYVPTTNLDVIEKYIGTDDVQPKLSKLGSQEWQKQKQKVRKSLEIVAKDLVELYAKRQLGKGFKFQKIRCGRKSLKRSFHIQRQKVSFRP